jgi:hypothetical protein
VPTRRRARPPESSIRLTDNRPATSIADPRAVPHLPVAPHSRRHQIAAREAAGPRSNISLDGPATTRAISRWTSVSLQNGNGNG